MADVISSNSEEIHDRFGAGGLYVKKKTDMRDISLLTASLPSDLAHQTHLLVKAARTGEPSKELQDCAMCRLESFTPLVILAGACTMKSASEVRRFQRILVRAFEFFEGTLFSGGTTAGISGMAGSTAHTLAKKAGKRFELTGYLPSQIPGGARKDTRYDAFIETQASRFSELEPIQMWTDLIVSGVSPSAVKLLGFNGGKVAAFEYRLALALGATVALIQDSGGEAATLLMDPEWRAMSTLLTLPLDAMTIAAFLESQTRAVPSRAVERMARAIHGEYLKHNKRKPPDPSVVPWTRLPEHLKLSNRKQAAWIAVLLRRTGFSLGATDCSGGEMSFSEDEVEEMAEMEHGRWNFERIQAGWTLGSRDLEHKVSPYLVPWKELPEDIKGYDRDAVRAFPGVLRQAQFTIVRK